MKQLCRLLPFLTCIVMLCACSLEKTDTKRMQDIDYTVVDPQEIPEELASQIEKAAKKPFQITYGDGGYLFIARGYGTKDTSGYSVEVPSCYETSNVVVMESNLLGPSKQEEVLQRKTCPYVVIKIEYTDKNVVFD